MKKLFALILAAMMLTVVGCAWAEEPAAEITFQDIPWGSSIEMVAEWVIQQEEYSMSYDTAEKILTMYMPWYEGSSHHNMILTADGTPLDRDTDADFRDVLANWCTFGGERGELAGFAIAGYKMNEIYYNFTRSEDSTGLISVGVNLDFPGGADAAFADLQQKLRSVYGAGDIDDETVYFKTGANNTAVLLRKGETPMLVYGVTNAVTLLNDILCIETPASTADPADTDGL